MLLLFTCPNNDNDCFDLGSIAGVNDLITLLPKQDIYNQGDQVTLKLEIPAINSYFGQEVNLITKTNDISALVVLAFNQLFIGNDLAFVSGSIGDSPKINWFNAPYNIATGNYELEVIVTLNTLGDYSFQTDDSVQFNGQDECNRYRLDTNVLWSVLGTVSFSVIE